MSDYNQVIAEIKEFFSDYIVAAEAAKSPAVTAEAFRTWVEFFTKWSITRFDHIAARFDIEVWLSEGNEPCVMLFEHLPTEDRALRSEKKLSCLVADLIAASSSRRLVADAIIKAVQYGVAVGMLDADEDEDEDED